MFSEHNPRDRVVLIAGAMKCGTTSLYDYLLDHDEICPCSAKEPEFFTEYQGHGRMAPQYWDLWPEYDPKRHTYLLEASTGYTKYPWEQNVPERIHAYGVRPKIIYVVRNPFERIMSHWTMMTATRPGWNKEPTDHHLINVSNYALQLDQFRPYVPREDIHIIDFDDLKGDPETVVRNTWRFLGLPDAPVRAVYEPLNSRRSTRNVLRALNRPPLSRIKWLVPARSIPPMEAAASFLFPVKRRSMSASERQVIFERLEKSMLRFQDEYGFDVSKWGFQREYALA